MNYSMLAACSAALWLLSAQVATSRPFTVDDLLKEEQIDDVKFDISGKNLYFNRLDPFDLQSDFGRNFIPGQMRSHIYTADLESPGQPRMLFGQSDGSYVIQSFSPDGRYAAFQHATDHSLEEGVIELRAHSVLTLVPRSSWSPPTWTATGRLVKLVLSAEGSDEVFDIYGERLERLESRLTDRRYGSRSTAERIGSGRFRAAAQPGKILVIADPTSGSLQPLGSGEFLFSRASPDGRVIASLRSDPLVDPAGALREHGANMEGQKHTLVVFDTIASEHAVSACPGCDVLPDSLSWSADSQQLVFGARGSGGTWSAPSFYVYDRSTRESHPVNLQRFRAAVSRNGPILLQMHAAWLGRRLVVQAKPALDEGVRTDWYLVGNGTPKNLTGELRGQSPELVAATADRLIFLQEGRLWSVDSLGTATRLAQQIAAPLVAWQERGKSNFDSPPVQVVAVVASSRGKGTPQQVVFVNINNGHTSFVEAPSPTAHIAALSVASGCVAFLDSASGATVLSIGRPDGTSRQLLEVNSYLRQVEGGTPVRIDYLGPDGGHRSAWLLLPPGYRRGERLATIVNVYPGRASGPSYPGRSISDFDPLNDNILASHGYAVLYPEIPLTWNQVPRDPMSGLADEALAAVDAAAREGYVDPSRIALQGHSYGGFATAAILSETNRFKSGVALSGVYDLLSLYGTFDRRLDPAEPDDRFRSIWLSWLETSQGGMGAPPWADVERYTRNSPLIHVPTIETPILIIHGDSDSVSVTQSEELFSALNRLNKDAVFVRYYGEDHLLNSPANIRDMWQRVLLWYRDTLGSRLTIKP